MLRASAAMAVAPPAAMRRLLWARRLTVVRSFASVADEDEANVDVTPQRKRAIAAAAKRGERDALLPSAVEAFQKAAGHYIVPFDLKASATRDNEPSTNGTGCDNTDLVGSTRYSRVFGRVQHTSEIDWPEEMVAQELPIGRLFHTFMTKSDRRFNHPQVVSALKDIGFPVDEATQDWTLFVWKHETMVVLRRFYELNGHSLVAQDFVVPRGDPQWSETTWGYLLGQRVNRIRTNKDNLVPSQLADLEEIEFPLDTFEHVWTKRILPSLQVFRQVEGHCDVTKAFVVPSEEPWPKEAWGLKLGNVVDSMRNQRAYATQTSRDADRLQAIDFVWDSMDNRWTTVVLPTLEMYFLIFGHSHIPLGFVVPSEAPWVKGAWGTKPGGSLRNMRNRGDYAEQRQRDHARLEAIGLTEVLIL